MSAFPEEAVSSPGLLSDVAGPQSSLTSFCAGVQPSSSGGRIQSPPGLPLSDPPRVTGAYGVPAYDPDFGLFLFFGSTLLGYVPGSAPFSQQSPRNYRNV